MRPVLYIHIGRPKTGSTALQHFLMKNRQQLLTRGVLYPLTGCHQLSSHLFAYAYSDRLRAGAHLPAIDQRELWLALGEEVKDASAGRVVLSSENFWFVDPRRVKDDIDGKYDVRVIAYIRRQDNVIASSFCEEVKRELISLDADVEEFALDPLRLELLDYLAILDEWSSCFGLDNLAVRVYERLSGGCIASDFCRLLAIEPGDLEIDQVTVNPALPYDVLSLISNANAFKSGDAAKRRFVTALSEAVALLDPDPRYDAAGLFCRELRERIMRVFEKSNAEISRKYLRASHGGLFPSLNEEEFHLPCRDMDQSRISRLLLGLQANQEKSNIRFLRRVAKLEREVERQKELIASLLDYVGKK